MLIRVTLFCTQLRVHAVPEDLSIYNEFNINGMEDTSVRVVAQTPMTRYVIDGMDAAQDDTPSIMEPADISNRTVGIILFWVVPLLSLVCMLIYIMEMVTIRVYDNHGLPEGMDSKQGRTRITPEDYYQWIGKRQIEASNDDTHSLQPKNYMWTWIGSAYLLLPFY